MKRPNKKLVQFRDGLGLTKQQFADILGITYKMIHFYEEGREFPRYSTWIQMKHKLKEQGIDLPDSIFYSDEMQHEVDESTMIEVDSLLACRELLGYSRKEMGKLVGLTEFGYGRYERGEREPLAEVWLKFKAHAKVHGIKLVEKV